MKNFFNKLTECFKIIKAIFDAPIDFNCWRIEQDEQEWIKMKMETYTKSLNTLKVTILRQNEAESKATDKEYKRYPSFAGNLKWLGNIELPQAAYVA